MGALGPSGASPELGVGDMERHLLSEGFQAAYSL